MKKKVLMRKCLGCNEMKDKRTLIRIVKSKDNKFAIDLTGKLNGRGAYVCNNMACFEKVKKTKGLNRAFKHNVPEDIYITLYKEINKIE